MKSIIHTLMALLLCCSANYGINSMNRETTPNQISNNMVIMGIKKLPSELKMQIISFLLQSTLGYRFTFLKSLDVKSPVFSLAYSPQGESVLTGLDNKTACVWNAKTGKLQTTLKGHTEKITSVAWSPQGKTILTGSEDTTARVWSLKTGELIKTFSEHSDYISSVAFSPQGDTILIGSWDATAYMWSLETGKLVTTFQEEDPITSVTYSPDGAGVLIGTWNKKASIWNAKTGKRVTTLKGHRKGINSVAWSPDGETVLTGSQDKTGCLWNSKTGKLLTTLKGHTGEILSVAFNPTGETVFTVSEDTTTCVWSCKTGEPLRTFKDQEDGTCIACSPTGRMILIGSWNNTVHIWKSLRNFEDLTQEQKTASFKQFMAWYPLLLKKTTYAEDSSIQKQQKAPLEPELNR